MQGGRKTGEQLQAELEALRHSTELYRCLVVESPVGVWELDEAGRTVFANPSMAGMLGYTEQEMLGRSFWDYPFDDSDAALAREKLLDGVRGRNDRFEFRFKHKNGDPVWTEIMGRILVKSRRPTGGVAQVVDISARKRTEMIHAARLRLMEFASGHSVEELLVATLDEVELVTGSKIGFYHMLSADQETIELKAWSTRTTREMCTARGLEIGTNYDVSMAGVWVDCIHERRTVIHNDYASLPHKKGMPPGHAPVVRELVTPVIRNGAIVAILGVGNKPTDYGEADVEAIHLLADLAWDIVEQKRSIQAVRESEEKFRVVADFTNDWEIWSHPDGHLLYVSPSCETITGYTPQEFAERPDLVADIVHPDDRELFHSHVEEHRSSRDSGKLEYRIVTKSGEVRWISHHCRNVQDSQGRQLGRRISNRNVSRRRRAEESLRESKERYRTLFEKNMDGIAIIESFPPRVRLSNPAYTRMFGLEPTNARPVDGDTFWSFIHPDDHARVKDVYKRGFIEKETTSRYEARIIRRDGSIRWVDILGTLIDFRGKPACLTICRDITERKQAQVELQKTYDLLSAIIEAAPVAIIGLDLEGKVQSVWNPAAENMLGWSAAEAMGSYLPSVPVDREEEFSRFREWIRSGKTMNGVEVRRSRRDGSPIDYSIYASPLHDAHGAITGNIAVLVDTTERKRAEEALRESEERLRLTLEATQIGIFDWDLKNDRWYASPTYYTMLGYPPKMGQGDRGEWMERVHPDDRAYVNNKILDELSHCTKEYQYEARMLHADGSYRWQQVMGFGIELDQDGKVRRILGIRMDITERKRAEQEREAHVRFFESMDRVNRAIQGAPDLDVMMRDVLDAVLAIFDCDRAFLMYPCDPESATWRVPMERNRPEYPGASTLGLEIPMDAHMAGKLRELLASDRPMKFGAESDHPLPEGIAQRFGIRSMMSIAVHPRIGSSWEFGIHQCSYPRVWSSDEETLLREIGRRLEDALTVLLSLKDLRESEAKYRRIVDTSGEGIWVLREDLRITFVNERMAEMIGHRVEEMVGRPMTSFLFEEDVPDHLAKMGIRPQGAPESHELRLRRKDGQALWTLVSAVPIFDDEYNFNGSFAMLSDITARRQAEEEVRRLNRELERRVAERTAALEAANSDLRQRTAELQYELKERRRAEVELRINEERYRMAQEIGHVGNWEFDPQTALFWGSEESRRLFGFDIAQHTVTMDELTNCMLEKERFPRALFDLIEVGKPFHLEYEIRPRNSTETRIIASVADVQRDQRGQPLRIVGVIQDVTQRKRTEEALQRERERSMLGQIAEASPVAIMMVDSDGVVTFANRQAENLLGLTRDENMQHSDNLPDWSVIREALWSFVHPDDLAGVQENLNRRTGGKETTSRHEARILRRDGSIRWVDVSATVISFNDRIANLVILHDLTERKREEQFRQDVERIIRHDIKSPLFGVYSLAQMAIRHNTHIDLRDLFPQIIRAVQQVVHLLDASEQWRKMEAGEYLPPGKPLDLSQVLHGVAASLAAVAEESHVGITVSVDVLEPARGVVHGEGFLIEDMLTNLMKNAVEASPAGKSVSVALRTEPDAVHIDIHNMGVIPESIRDHFFDKYASAGKPGGMGLGTYSALLIAKAHGGEINFDTSDAGGTTVSVVLPRRAAPPPGAA